MYDPSVDAFPVLESVAEQGRHVILSKLRPDQLSLAAAVSAMYRISIRSLRQRVQLETRDLQHSSVGASFVSASWVRGCHARPLPHAMRDCVWRWLHGYITWS